MSPVVKIEIDPIEELLKAIGIVHGKEAECEQAGRIVDIAVKKREKTKWTDLIRTDTYRRCFG